MANIIRFGGGASTGGSYGTLPAQVINFYASGGNAQVTLTWANPTDDNFSGTLIVRKTGSYPVKPADGVKVYTGAATSYTDTGLTNDVQYYYRAFAYNSKTEYQTVYIVATATPKAGILASTLPIGAKVKFGSIFGNKIVQTIANKKDNLITLITDKAVFYSAFDAKEKSGNDARGYYGSNRYLYSNINQWLNSTAPAGQWYAAQTSTDNPPTTNNIYNNKLPYDTFAGYLSEWASAEINKLQTVNITAALAATDGGGTETIPAKIYLPSASELGITNSGFTEGQRFSLFSDDASRLAYITNDVISYISAYYGGLSSTYLANYWTRTPYIGTLTDGIGSQAGRIGGGNSGANGEIMTGRVYTDYGIRPCCSISGDTLFSAEPDADNCYTLAGG